MTVLLDLSYDTGDLNQWNTKQLAQSYSGTAQQVIRRKESGYAARFEVRSGDDPINANGERAELATTPAEILGQGDSGGHVFIGWSTYFPDPGLNPTAGGSSTNIFTQIHEDAPSRNVPPVRISINTGVAYPYVIRVLLSGQGGAVTTIDVGAPRYNDWNDFVIEAVWHTDPTIGMFAMWRDGVQVIAPTMRTTQWVNDALGTNTGLPQNNYLKQGWYRSDNALTSVVFHDETRVADTYADAKPPPRLTPIQGQVVRVPDGLGGFAPVFRRKIA